MLFSVYNMTEKTKLCPPSLSKSSFARSNLSIGTQKGFLGRVVGFQLDDTYVVVRPFSSVTQRTHHTHSELALNYTQGPWMRCLRCVRYVTLKTGL